MRDLWYAISAELMKLRRTLALKLAILMPLLIVVLQSTFILRAPPARIKAGIWHVYEQGVAAWAIFLLPLLASLLAVLIQGIEHRENNWKLLYSLPLPRWTVHAAKLLSAQVLLAIASASLVIGMILGAVTMHALYPRLPYGAISVPPLLNRLGVLYLCAAALVAIHVWVSARSRSSTLPLGLGVGGVLVSIVAANDSLVRFWPWMLPMNSTIPERQFLALILGLSGGVAFAVLGAWDCYRREIT